MEQSKEACGTAAEGRSPSKGKQEGNRHYTDSSRNDWRSRTQPRVAEYRVSTLCIGDIWNCLLYDDHIRYKVGRRSVVTVSDATLFQVLCSLCCTLLCKAVGEE